MANTQTVSFRMPEILSTFLRERAKEENTTVTAVICDSLFTAMVAHYMLELGQQDEVGLTIQLMKEQRAKKDAA